MVRETATKTLNMSLTRAPLCYVKQLRKKNMFTIKIITINIPYVYTGIFTFIYIYLCANNVHVSLAHIPDYKIDTSIDSTRFRLVVSRLVATLSVIQTLSL